MFRRNCRKEIKEKDSKLEKFKKKSSDKENKENEGPNFNLEQARYEEIMKDFERFDKGFQAMYERMKFGLTENWTINDFNEYRKEMISLSEKYAKMSASSKLKHNMLKICHKIGNQTDNFGQSFCDRSQEEAIKLKFADINKKKAKVKQTSYFANNDYHDDKETHNSLYNRINGQLE
jgi:hypothetical protein